MFGRSWRPALSWTDCAPVPDPVTVGIGQSMGGALTIVQQGRFHCYDGIGVLGLQPVAHPSTGGTGHVPGRAARGWVATRCRPTGVFTNGFALALSLEGAGEQTSSMAWGFHFDDVAPDVVARDMEGYPLRGGDMPGWGSAGIPMTVALWSVTPGGALGRGGGGSVAGPRCVRRARRARRSRGARRGLTSRRPAWTSSCARAWRTCTTSPGRASCSGSGSRRGRTGCGTGRLRNPERVDGGERMRTGASG